jgi:uncharacterized membrane protein YdjX (TVP38/TMEM64 family)
MKDTLPGTKYTAELFVRPVLILGLLLLGVVALRETSLPQQLLSRTDIFRIWPWGHLAFLVIATAWCLFGLPRQVMCLAAGGTFGLMEGTVIATLGTAVGSIMCFWMARYGGRSWARQKLGRRFQRLDMILTAEPFLTVLMLRMLPVGSAFLVNLLAGVSGMSVWKFLSATMMGGLPQTFMFVLLGGGVYAGNASDWRLTAIAGTLLFVAAGATGLVLGRRLSAMTARQTEAEAS